jgi:hypothetical protein
MVSWNWSFYKHKKILNSMMGHLMVVLFTNYSKKKKKANKSLTNIYGELIS